MRRYCISPTSTLLQCLQVIDSCAAGIALAVDADRRLIGTVTDGDIRRALLQGATLDQPVLEFVKRDCFRVSPSTGRAEVLDIMQARRFEQVPVVDEEGRLVGLHLLHDILGRIERSNWAVIMAGGQGTRLRPLTDAMPKPMLNVAGRPILERIILHLVSYGVRRIFLAVNHLAQIIEEFFADGSKYGASIEYLREEKPLGSGGAISLLPELPHHPLIVMNGDLIVDTNIGYMIDFHDEHRFFASMGVYPYFHEVPYGCVDIDGNRLVGMEEKPLLRKMVNTGIYVLSTDAVSAVPKNTHFPITSLFEEALKKNLPCGVFEIENEWLDIGLPQQLRQARGQL